jgi:hypothetical protein
VGFTAGARLLRSPGLSRLGTCTLATTTTTTAIVPLDSAFADPRRLALAGFLASYSGPTQDAYALDLRQFVPWCDEHSLDVFAVRRFDIESFARDLEARRRARATVARRLWLLPLRGGRRSPRPLAGGAFPATPHRLRVPMPPRGTRTRSARYSLPPDWEPPKSTPIASLLVLDALRVPRRRLTRRPTPTMRYDRGPCLVRPPATCIVSAFLAGAAR